MKITEKTIMTMKPVLFMDYTKGGYRQEYAIYINEEYTGVNKIIQSRKRQDVIDIRYSTDNKLLDNLADALRDCGHEVDTNEPTD